MFQLLGLDVVFHEELREVPELVVPQVALQQHGVKRLVFDEVVEELVSRPYEVDSGVVQVRQVLDEFDFFLRVGAQVAVVRQQVRLLVVFQLLNHALAD